MTAFLVFARATVCFPVGEFSVRAPCYILTFSANPNVRADEWTPPGKSAVVYTFEDRDLNTALSTAGTDVCKGTVTLRFGAVVDVLVFIRPGPMQVSAVRGVQYLYGHMAGTDGCLFLRECVCSVLCRLFTLHELPWYAYQYHCEATERLC